ncbi:MAG: glycosyltransferase [Hormoscilla sp. GM102CHS1]|nr:glycosyltransferase [Hormoscilla sp. GM102CHS1]
MALVYPSKYEGFGLPVLEAMACGCPVITSPNASIPEVAGEAVIYVHDEDVDGLVNALCEVQKPGVRNSSIAAGLEQAKKFSWSTMAEKVSSALMDATLLGLNGRGRTGGHPPILPFETGLAIFTAGGYWVIGPCHG